MLSVLYRAPVLSSMSAKQAFAWLNNEKDVDKSQSRHAKIKHKWKSTSAMCIPSIIMHIMTRKVDHDRRTATADSITAYERQRRHQPILEDEFHLHVNRGPDESSLISCEDLSLPHCDQTKDQNKKTSTGLGTKISQSLRFCDSAQIFV
jgi:hypothetical protein